MHSYFEQLNCLRIAQLFCDCTSPIEVIKLCLTIELFCRIFQKESSQVGKLTLSHIIWDEFFCHQLGISVLYCLIGMVDIRKIINVNVICRYEEIFKQYNHHKRVRVFTYLIGREISDLKAANWMACHNRGDHIKPLFKSIFNNNWTAHYYY